MGQFDEFIVIEPVLKHGPYVFKRSPHYDDPEQQPRIKERGEYPGLTESDVKALWEAGFVSVPGLEDQTKVPGKSILVPKESTVPMKEV